MGGRGAAPGEALQLDHDGGGDAQLPVPGLGQPAEVRQVVHQNVGVRHQGLRPEVAGKYLM